MNARPRADVPPNEVATILLVEDEILIRMDAADELRTAGFSVIEASNGDEALSVLKLSQTVSMVITDVNMPGNTDGLALAAWLRKERPHVKTLVISGNVAHLSSSDVADLTLSKPLRMGSLVPYVRQLLSGT